MKKNGFSLAELVTAMVLSGILVTALTCQFVAMSKFSNVLQGKIEAAREARIIMHHMARTIRSAKPDAVSPVSPDFVNNANENKITVTTEAINPNWTKTYVPGCYYRLDNTTNPKAFYFFDGTSEILLSRAVTYFNTDNTGNALWDPATNELKLQLQFTVNNVTIPIETTMQVLGE
ncbi:MAG: type II secretion system protein [Candidatus Omnitrophota bacterium]|nr:type II secretion system protein [Candidatus Omnitrophota bacterium]